MPHLLSKRNEKEYDFLEGVSIRETALNMW
jgi:hypothetical protein